jgi:hypothetical protein
LVAGAGLHHPGGFDEEFASHQVPVGVVHRFEVVEVEKEDAEGLAAIGPCKFAFQRLVEVARVVEAGEVIEVDEVLGLLDAVRVVKRERQVLRQVVGGVPHAAGFGPGEEQHCPASQSCRRVECRDGDG